MAAAVIKFEPDPNRRRVNREWSAAAERLEIQRAKNEILREREALAQAQRELGEDRRDLQQLRRQREWRDAGAALRRRLVEARITQQRVADEAGVSRFLVSHVLAGRAQSRNVVDAAERLLSHPR
jgi:CRP-like cAMP-binding protein